MRVCHYLRGAVSFNELINMPVKKYLLLKRACEIESLSTRHTAIYDFNRAFNDPKPLLDQLQKEIDKRLAFSKKMKSASISWKKDPDWKQKLSAIKV